MKFNLINSALVLCIFFLFLTIPALASQTDIAGPAGSGTFGENVTVLPNGNFVVVDSGYDLSSPAVSNVGAVYLYDGATLAVISTLTGSTANDAVGNRGITVLTNGNFVVRSPSWNNPSPAMSKVGAVTWCSAAVGCNGVVSSANSLIGKIVLDSVGDTGVTPLTNGNYVVRSSSWDNPLPYASNVGAVTWGNGTTGTSGLVSSSNSLIGSTTRDIVGDTGVTALTNGNYVVRSQAWDNPSPLIADVGAVTFGNGTTGISGLVSSSNSLIGGTAGDAVGDAGVTALTNGNYVVRSINWNNPSLLIADVGAVTWGNGTTGTSGLVTAANSLIGGTANDRVGSGEVVALTNGNYVVRSNNWDNPSPLIADVGAITWGNGTTGTSGLVSSSNSLIGGTASDVVGNAGVTALTNGNYVVRSDIWDNPSPLATDARAITYGNGNIGTTGLISSANSVLGTVTNGISGFSFDDLRNRVIVGRGASNIVSILFFETNATSNGTFSTPGIWDNGVPDTYTNGVIPNGRTVSLNSAVTVGLVSVGCTGAFAGITVTRYVIGNVQKDYCAATNESFTYPIGDAAN